MVTRCISSLSFLSSPLSSPLVFSPFFSPLSISSSSHPLTVLYIQHKLVEMHASFMFRLRTFVEKVHHICLATTCTVENETKRHETKEHKHEFESGVVITQHNQKKNKARVKIAKNLKNHKKAAKK